MHNHSAENTLESSIQPLVMPLGQSLWTSQANFEDVKNLCSDKPLAGGPICVSALACSNWQFTLAKPICILETYERGTWTRRYDPLGILAYGRSREEAIAAFCEEFACCWEEIALEEDANLTSDAQELKGKLRSTVKDAKPLE
jgi:hypothetical protein